MSLLYLTALSLNSCATFNVKQLTPSFVDTVNNQCREYKVVQDKPKVEFGKDPIIWPLAHCNGYIALPTDQVTDMRRHYEESIRNGPGPIFGRSSVDEIDVLNGIPWTDVNGR